MSDRSCWLRRSGWLSVGAGALQLSLTRYHPTYHEPPHAHDAHGISIVLGGAMAESVGAHTEHATATSVVVKPAGTRHANRAGGSGAILFALAVEEAGAAGTDTDATAGWERAAGSWRWQHGGKLAPALLRLLCDWRELPELASETLEARLWELRTALAPDRDPGLQPGTCPSWVGRVVDRLRSEFRERPSVAALAADADVHPVYLTRALRRWTGTSVVGLTRRLRVQAAADLIATTDAPLARIAADTGFADESHLCRVFQHETGVRPSVLRTRRPEV